jgi:hypothetical protein
MRRAVPALLLCVPLVSCGTQTPASTATQVDAGTCGYAALFATSNYSSSGFGGFTLDGNGRNQGDISMDPALSFSNGRVFYVSRDLGELYELDACGAASPATRLNDPGSSVQSNPQDVAAASDGTLWVPRYDEPSVVAIAPDGTFTHTISLASTSYDPDGNPNASAIAIASVGTAEKAFVALGVLDDDIRPPVPYPDHPSIILRIDVATGAVDGQTALQGHNPFGLFVPYAGKLWMAEPGDFSSTTETAAGIEWFDPQTQTSQLITQETAFGGSVAEIAVTAGCGAAIVADATAQNATSLVTFDPDSGAALTTAAKPVLATTGYDLQAMLWVGTTLLVGDRSVTTSGKFAVHAFDVTAACTLTQRTETIFLPEQPVAFQPAPH